MNSKKLKALAVERLAKKPGTYHDGAGLMLVVSSPTASSWVLRFQLDGKRRDMGLGPFPAVTLEKAREKASAARRLVKADGADPIDAARLETAGRMTFAECAEAYIATNKAGWRSAKHGKQWATTLKDYAFPFFGSLPVQAVNTALVTQVLRPLWNEKRETALRLRGRIEAILDWAAVSEFRRGDNPARWKGHLENVFPRRSKAQVPHHAALPYAEVAAFMAALKALPGIAVPALQFAVLTAARAGEAIGATWDEIDFNAALWTVSADRIKAAREHRVPLSAPAMAILRKQHAATGGEGLVFPGMKPGRPLSNTAFLMLLRRMGRGDLTAHGFRSSFRDWASEQTNYAREVCEMALAHAIGDKVEAAYRRGDLFEKRKRLMAAWGTFCTAPPSASKVIPMQMLKATS